MYYKGNNIGLNYDAATGTWVFNNEPQDFVDTNAFTTADPEFEMAPVVDDEEEEEVQCPEGYIYDNTLKQCVPDPSVQNKYTETTNDGNNNDQPSVQIAGTDRTTSNGNFIASDAEYDAMSAAELVENYKQRGMVNKDDDGNLIIDISPDMGDQLFDAGLSRFGQGGETLAGQKKHLRRLFEKKMIHSDLNPNLMNFYPSGITSTEDYINKFPITLLNSGDNAKIKIPTKNDPSVKFVAGDTSTPFTAGFGTATYLDRKMSQGSDKRAPVFGDITTGFNKSVSNYASNFANAYITNPNFNPKGTIGTSQDADKFDDIEQSKRREAQALAEKAEAAALEKKQKVLKNQKEEREEREIKDFTNLNTGQSTTDSSGDTYTKKDDGGYTFTPSKPNVNTPTKTYENKRKYGGYTGSTAGRGGTTKAKSSPSKPKMTTPNPHTRSGFSN